jgi:transposase
MRYKLKPRPKSGRPSEISEEIEYRIKKELKESNSHGWGTTKQVEKELIVKKSVIKYPFIHTHIPSYPP